MSAPVEVKVVVTLRVDLDAYALNYGEGYPASEAVDYARDLVADTLPARFQQVGEWATVLDVDTVPAP